MAGAAADPSVDCREAVAVDVDVDVPEAVEIPVLDDDDDEPPLPCDSPAAAAAPPAVSPAADEESDAEVAPGDVGVVAWAPVPSSSLPSSSPEDPPLLVLLLLLLLLPSSPDPPVPPWLPLDDDADVSGVVVAGADAGLGVLAACFADEVVDVGRTVRKLDVALTSMQSRS